MPEQTIDQEIPAVAQTGDKPKYPGFAVTCNGNQLVTEWVETRVTEGGVAQTEVLEPRQAVKFINKLSRRAHWMFGAIKS